MAALVLAAYAALAGAAAPYALARARWAHRMPKVAVLAWQGLMATFVVSTALAVHRLVLAEQHVHGGLVGLLHLCGVPAAGAGRGDMTPTVADAALLLPPLLVALLPAAWLLRAIGRGGRGGGMWCCSPSSGVRLRSTTPRCWIMTPPPSIACPGARGASS
ncbi:hypothetical protein [Streptomyces boninensis]|uniref:hypothetical protein n=1 Tax=Streptomyces boninensis TaxID=2039455 RepID=UPI003B210022